MSLNWLVTGAAGFIGSNLCAHLLERGHRVTGLDNLVTGNRENIDRLEAMGAPFRYIQGDIRDTDIVSDAARDADVVVNLAAHLIVQESFADFRYNASVNIDGFLAVMEAAHKAGAARFVFASTCAVYGNNQALPLGEESAAEPISPYGLSKLINENYAALLRDRMLPMEMIGLRFFNVFGPWQDSKGGYAAVIAKWIELLLNGEEPVMYGDGSASRDFCFVGDVAALIEVIATRSEPLEPPLFTVCTGTSTDLKTLYDTIVRSLEGAGAPVAFSKPRQEPWRAGDIVHSIGDPRLAEQTLGFRPSCSLSDGVCRILAEQHGLPARST